MAITANDSRFLFFAKSLGVSFEKTLMLGRLELYVSRNELEKIMTQFGDQEKKFSEIQFKDKYSEPLFELLGASSVDSMDFSDYEKATILHDLNNPIPDSFKKMYTAILDSGTIEHVFNFPVAIKNCMEALQVGGHYLAITPANNTMGHGFYQFSPELFYNVFNESNGFKVEKMIICTVSPKGEASDWYEVIDPQVARDRVTLVNSSPTYLMLFAKKIAEKNIFASTPQQSDYQSIWAISQSQQGNKVAAHESRIKHYYRKLAPRPLRIFLHNLHGMFTKDKRQDENLGEITSGHFKRVELKK